MTLFPVPLTVTVTVRACTKKRSHEQNYFCTIVAPAAVVLARATEDDRGKDEEPAEQDRPHDLGLPRKFGFAAVVVVRVVVPVPVEDLGEVPLNLYGLAGVPRAHLVELERS